MRQRQQQHWQFTLLTEVGVDCCSFCRSLETTL